MDDCCNERNAKVFNAKKFSISLEITQQTRQRIAFGAKKCDGEKIVNFSLSLSLADMKHFKFTSYRKRIITVERAQQKGEIQTFQIFALRWLSDN